MFEENADIENACNRSINSQIWKREREREREREGERKMFVRLLYA